MHRPLAAVLLVLALVCTATFAAETVLDLTTAKLTLDGRGAVTGLKFADGTAWPASGRSAFALETAQGELHPESAKLDGQKLTIVFPGGSTAELAVKCDRGFAVFRLVKLTTTEEVKRLRLFSLPVPADSQSLGALNAAEHDGRLAAVMAAEVNVHALRQHTAAYRSDRAGCGHDFVQDKEDAKVGKAAARFVATCDAKPGGWSMRGRALPQPLDLTGCKAIRAWVHGDGQGQQLKIQLYDGRGGYRDNYLTIDFTGWRRVELTKCPINTLRYDQAAALNFYYNGMPAGKKVTCLIDQVEAVIERDGAEQVVVLEDFESPDSPLWSLPVPHLVAQTYQRHGIEPAAFGLIACPRTELLETIERFEPAAGLPSPRPGGAWNKQSPWIGRSYFFLTGFSEDQFDEALAIARRGGFHMILIGQGSWCRSTGHYEVNRRNFPDGLEGLKRTVQRFRDAGFHVGFHFLAASIYPPDAYLTPVPDPRLVKGATTTLGADIDEKADFVPVPGPPREFADEDGGYRGNGTVLQIGDELIHYAERSMEPPFGFKRCRRGYRGTKPAAHNKGDRLAHLVRSYGYHMIDMDTTLLDEVAGHFARVANACAAEMLYFDGSERLQGDHWYYNAKLHKAFYDKLQNKDALLQASSFSHYSWHMLARSASADGHGDLKGYLDERSPWFLSFGRSLMPLDIGWYYGYDPGATPDEYEYILGATLGYDSSMSFQVSPGAARRHPFTGEVLDLIARYERLRLSRRVSEQMKARLRIDPVLGGEKEPSQRAKLLDHRREYRLLGPQGHEVFQRVVYDPWHEITSPEEENLAWDVQFKQGPARVGVQIHARGGPWLRPGPSYHAEDAVLLETFDDLAPYARAPKKGQPVHAIEPGQAGSVLPGVSQRLESTDKDAREGPRCALYTAESTLADNRGWSAIGRQFAPPLDLSRHKAIGFWIRGDGRGGSFKLQLRDDKGATDYYITNDFTGWRYQQLARPEKDPIDYAKVRSLTFYYNGLPGRTKIACDIDDVKALSRLDARAIVDPWVEVGGKRFAWQGTLAEGQYLFFWPGEAVARYGPPLAQPERSAHKVPTVELPPGRHRAKFGCRGGPDMPLRARITLQPPERWEVGPANRANGANRGQPDGVVARKAI